MAPPSTSVLTTQQAARLLGMSTSSVQKLVSRGELTAWVTPGGHRRIDRASVERLAGARRVGQAPPEPAGTEAAAAAAAAPALRAPGQGLRVLLAEDDPGQARWFLQVLQAHHPGHRLSVAADASQALILLERERPDLLVTDLVMQPFDGFHLLHTLLAEPAWRGIEALVISGLGPEEVAARGGLPPGVTHYLKPVPLERLLGLLDGVLARALRA